MSAEPPTLPEDEKTPMVMSRTRFWTTSIVMMLILPVIGIGYIFLNEMKLRAWKIEQRERTGRLLTPVNWWASAEEFKFLLSSAQIVAVVEVKGDSSSEVKTILLDKNGYADSDAIHERIARRVSNWGLKKDNKVSYHLVIAGEGVMESLGQYFKTGTQSFRTYEMEDRNGIRVGGKYLSADDISKLLPVAKP